MTKTTEAQRKREYRARRGQAEKELARLKLKEELKAEMKREHVAQGFCPVCGAWPRKAQKEEKAKLAQLDASTTELKEDGWARDTSNDSWFKPGTFEIIE